MIKKIEGLEKTDESMSKKYEALRADNLKNGEQLKSEFSHKLGSEVLMAKKELTAHIDSKVNDVGKFQDEIQSHLKLDHGQNWTLVKGELTKMTQEIQQLESNYANELHEVQKALKESQVERKIEFETLEKDMKAKVSFDLNSKMKLNQSKIDKVGEKLLGVEGHFEVLRQELSKSIYLIDKHSEEIDELALKIKSTEEGKNVRNENAKKLSDLQDNVKTIQIHITNFRENMSKLDKVDQLEQQLKSITENGKISPRETLPLFCPVY